MNRSKAFATACLVGCFLIPGAFRAAAQEPAPQPGPKTEAPPPVPDQPKSETELEAEIDRLVNAYDLSPKPLPEIPDDPPPHEGAMIDLPTYRVEPTDLILVELLEALPGRPISGERLVLSDGTISLGFYGAIHVRGLTIEQVKVKIIKHMRKYLPDDVLGLVETRSSPEAVDSPDKPTPQPPHDALEAEPPSVVEESAKVIEVPLPNEAKITIRIEGGRRGTSPALPPPPPSFAPPSPFDRETIAGRVPEERLSPFEIGDDSGQDMERRALPPDASDRVFVDVTQYNSKNYFVLGHVNSGGKLPSTGKETVLHAIQYAGGLLTSGDPRDVRLVRPGRNGKPAKVYKIDLETIEERGETATNYQVFPDDRIYVGANELARKKYANELLSAELQEKTLRAKLAAESDAVKPGK